MVYGITGNTDKPDLWAPVSELIGWLEQQGLPFLFTPAIADGLLERGLREAAFCDEHCADDLLARSDLILSFGGDGTLLRIAREIGPLETPILGVNIGRLGFLADLEVGEVIPAIRELERGSFRIERRLVLEAHSDPALLAEPLFALNEIVIERGASASLISVRVDVDGRYLNTFWADGLIVSTSTGSTAYSLSVGGPLITPGSGVIVITPIAPHTLTVRPIILPRTSEITARVTTRGPSYLVAADGAGTTVEAQDVPIRVRRADHTVGLVKVGDRDYFATLREKLMWGQGRPTREEGGPD